MRWLLLYAILISGCGTGSLSSVGPTEVLNSADSLRYVQVEKAQPYALLWPRNNVLNLWLRVSATRSCGYPSYRTARREYVVVVRGHESLGVWTDDSASSPDSNFVSAFLRLQEETPDTLTGLAILTARDDCGDCRDTLSLRLARVLP